MPIELTDAIESVQRTLSLMPPAVLAIVMLAGPTAAWLLYRFAAQPQMRRRAVDGSELLWICESCRSANEIRSSRCYRCAMERDEIVGALQIVDGDGIVTLSPDDDGESAYPLGQPVMAAAASRPPVAVGPGRSRHEPAPQVDPAVEPARPSVAVGPGKPEPVAVRRPRKVVAAGRAEARDPGKTKRD